MLKQSIGWIGLEKANGLILAAALLCSGGLSEVFAAPKIITQPLNQSVSLGAKVTNLVSASTASPPLSYQWHFNGADIAGATNRTLILTNAHVVDAGSYSAVVADTSGSVTSIVVRLDVDPSFTIITAGPVVVNVGNSVGVSWGDYDNNGFLDLLVGNIDSPVDFLYRNKGDGTFEQVLTNVIAGFAYGAGAWGDYDNDGLLDLYTVSARDLGVRLFHNIGNGTLLRLTNAAVVGSILTDHTDSGNVAWGDYDNDGFLDVFVANGTFTGDMKNFLYHNQGNGSFARVTTGSIVNDVKDSWVGAWADYDDDGRLDLFVTNTGGEVNQMYHNDGAAGFTRLTAAQVGTLVNLPGTANDAAHGCAWGDYDNDGYLDLFVSGTRNQLYHNKGNGTFETTTNVGVIYQGNFETEGCTWVDYDNDGYLDLFVVQVDDNNFLYHNNGNGTFTRIMTGSLVNDGSRVSIDCAWGDYDNDGFMDLVIANQDTCSLFHNNGNTNHWINLQLVGTASNRSAVGAKVRLKATIGGKTFWQRRDIGCSGSQEGQSDLRASFGLGDATNIDTVRIEWPSGTVQELHNVASKQFLTVTEPARLKGSMSGGQYQLLLNGGVGFSYEVQSSLDLAVWTSLTNLVTTNMAMPVISMDAAKARQTYFRAVRQ